MQKATKARTFLFLALTSAAAFGMLFYVLLIQEGHEWADLPFFVGVSAASLVLAGIWFAAVDFSLRKALIAWPVLFIPFAMHGVTAVGLIYERFIASNLPAKLSVMNYEEEPLYWPGFDGPVGYRLTFDLAHPPGFKRLINGPEIRMGPEVDIPYGALSKTATIGSGYFKDKHLSTKTGNLAILKTVLHQRYFENPTSQNEPDKWRPQVNFDPIGRTRLTYDLLPGIVDYVREPGHICIGARTEGLNICPAGVRPDTGCAAPNVPRFNQPVYSKGTNLTALWLAPPTINLSNALTDALRSKSKLQNKPKDWRAMHLRMTPAGLKRAGYRLCKPGIISHNLFRVCFCRSPGARDDIESVAKTAPPSGL